MHRLLVFYLALACGALLPREAAAQYHFPVSTGAVDTVVSGSAPTDAQPPSTPAL